MNFSNPVHLRPITGLFAPKSMKWPSIRPKRDLFAPKLMNWPSIRPKRDLFVLDPHNPIDLRPNGLIPLILLKWPISSPRNRLCLSRKLHFKCPSHIGFRVPSRLNMPGESTHSPSQEGISWERSGRACIKRRRQKALEKRSGYVRLTQFHSA